jgi:hypothetical protein
VESPPGAQRFRIAAIDRLTPDEERYCLTNWPNQTRVNQQFSEVVNVEVREGMVAPVRLSFKRTWESRQYETLMTETINRREYNVRGRTNASLPKLEIAAIPQPLVPYQPKAQMAYLSASPVAETDSRPPPPPPWAGPRMFFAEFARPAGAKPDATEIQPQSGTWMHSVQRNGNATLETMGYRKGLFILKVTPPEKRQIKLTLFGVPEALSWKLDDESLVKLAAASRTATLDFNQEGRTMLRVNYGNETLFSIQLSAFTTTNTDKCLQVILQSTVDLDQSASMKGNQ